MGRVGKRLLSSFINVGNVMLEALCARPPFGSAPPGPGSWAALPSAPSATYLGTAVAFGSDIFLFGGRAPTAQTNAIRKFNTLTNTWSTVGTLPWSAEAIVGVVINGLIYVHAGGSGASRFGNLVSFNPSNNAVTVLAGDVATTGAAAVAIGNKMYVFGGQTTNTVLNTIRCYDPVTNQWTALTPSGVVPTARYFVSAAAADGKMYIVSGATTGTVVVKSIDVYDPVANAFEQALPISFGIYAMGVGIIGRYLYVVGGSNQGPTVDDTRIYNLDTKSWSSGAVLPKKLGYLPMAIVGDKLYTLGGYSSTAGGGVTDQYLYTPA